MPFTSAWGNAVGDHSLGTSDIGSLGNVYLALLLGNPGDSGSVSSEVTGTGYARQLLTGSIGSFASKVATNTAEIDFGSPGSDWGTIPYVGVMTHVSAGIMRFYQQLPTPRVALSGGRPVKFAIGKLSFVLV